MPLNFRSTYQQPTITGFTTYDPGISWTHGYSAIGIFAQWGTDIIGRVRIDSNANGSGNELLTIDLPSGLEVDFNQTYISLVAASNPAAFYSYGTFNASVNSCQLNGYFSSGTQISYKFLGITTLSGASTGLYYNYTSTVPITVNTNTFVNVFYQAPILGWE